MDRLLPGISKQFMVLKNHEFLAIVIFTTSGPPYTFIGDNTRESAGIQAGIIEILEIGVCQVGR
jgi:hypothetical protein